VNGFYVADGKTQGNNAPHILACGHTVCGLCVKRAQKTLALVCNTCGIETQPSESQSFPLNAYLIGVSMREGPPFSHGVSQLKLKSTTTRIVPSGASITCPKISKHPIKSKFLYFERISFFSVIDFISPSDFITGDLCCECSGRSGYDSVRCLECDLPYCQCCFTKVSGLNVYK